MLFNKENNDNKKINRVYSPPKAKLLSEALEGVVNEFGLGIKRDNITNVRLKWEEVVGPNIAAHTRVTFYRKRTLYITVDSSALLQDLSTLRKDELKKKMFEGKNKLFVHEIRFKLGNLS